MGGWSVKINCDGGKHEDVYKQKILVDSDRSLEEVGSKQTV